MEIILNDVIKKGINEVIFTGDIGTKESHVWFFDSFRKYKLNYEITLGNRDLFSDVIKFYNPDLPKERKELFYTKEDEYFQYLFLNTSSSEISQSQLN